MKIYDGLSQHYLGKLADAGKDKGRHASASAEGEDLARAAERVTEILSAIQVLEGELLTIRVQYGLDAAPDE